MAILYNPQGGKRARGLVFNPIQFIDFRGKVVVFLQAFRKGKEPYGIVPGYKNSEPFRDETGIEKMEIEPIPPEFQEVIKGMLRGKLIGPINVW